MKRGTGLLALLGIGAGAVAFWQYKRLSPEKKEELKSKMYQSSRKIKQKLRGVDDTVAESYQSAKATAKRDSQAIRRETENVAP